MGLIELALGDRRDVAFGEGVGAVFLAARLLEAGRTALELGAAGGEGGLVAGNNGPVGARIDLGEEIPFLHFAVEIGMEADDRSGDEGPDLNRLHRLNRACRIDDLDDIPLLGSESVKLRPVAGGPPGGGRLPARRRGTGEDRDDEEKFEEATHEKDSLKVITTIPLPQRPTAGGGAEIAGREGRSGPGQAPRAILLVFRASFSSP